MNRGQDRATGGPATLNATGPFRFHDGHAGLYRAVLVEA